MAKIPIFYKSSDRYEAGTDVIYDDGSKLQFAPFIYASTKAKENGGDTPEEDDTMIINYDYDSSSIDKSYSELLAALKAGKICVFTISESETDYAMYYLTNLQLISDEYCADFTSAYTSVADEPTLYVLRFKSSDIDGVLSLNGGGGGGGGTE